MYLRFQNQLPLIYTKSGSSCSPLLDETSESIIITADLVFSGTDHWLADLSRISLCY